MDYKRLNPCEEQRVAQLFAWLATDCWCCSGARAMCAFLFPALFVGWWLPDWKWLGVLLFVAACAGLVGLALMLMFDRDEETPNDRDEETPK